MSRVYRCLALAAAFFLSLVVLSCGLATKTPWVGIWRGSVIFVNVEYDFTATTMEMRTFSGNDVMIASAKADIRVEGDLMHITENQRYAYDQDKGSGAWATSTDRYDARFKVEGGQMKFQPSTSAISLELTKQ